VDINLSYLHLEGGHLKLSYSNLPLVDIYLRGKYLFVLLNFSDISEYVIYIVIKSLGYCRRVTKRKGFSTNPIVMRKRLDFAQEAIN
jgi:hypothetical protein